MKPLKIILITALVISLIGPLFAQSPAEFNKRGVQYGSDKMFEKALREFDRALDIYNKASARVYHNRGWVLEMKKDYPEAIKNYEEAVRRNNLQVPSHERVGYLYYKTGDYEKAVNTGEYVLKIDPENQEVIKWLPDAYTKRLQQRQREIAAKKKAAEDKKGEEKKKCQDEEVLPRHDHFFLMTLDGVIRTAYYYRGDNTGYKYDKTQGYLAPFPYKFYMDIIPASFLEFDLLVTNPYLGALTPNVVIQTERFQTIFHLGKYYLGVGVMFNHFRDDFVYEEKVTLNDMKAGLVFGVNADKYRMRFLFYPRELPHDGKQSSGKTLDVDYVEYSVDYRIDKTFSFHLLLSANDYIFYDHNEKISHYWGVYEAGLGLAVSKYDSMTKQKSFAVTFDFILRLYMRDLNNPNPYRVFNGQGWMGANSEKWFKGDPFSGFRCTGHVFSLRGDEFVAKNVFLYQKLIFELISGEEDHNDISLLLGAGLKF